jgi:RNA-directed DNA polymerase
MSRLTQPGSPTSTRCGMQGPPRDADRFLADLRRRLAEFALTLHPGKTRLIEFGRHAATNQAGRGDGKPETFDFFGLTHICGVSQKRPGFQLWRKSSRKRMKAKIKAIKDELRPSAAATT